MRRLFSTLALAALLAAAPHALQTTRARAATADDVRATYERFAAAQNAHDLDRVREVLLDSPQFLWVSDGRSVWGREATLTRMSAFQNNAVWRVVPALDRATVVEVDAGAAYYHLPLVLELGATKDKFDRLKFLVSALCVKTPQGWRIAALFTTEDKGE